MIAVGTQPLTLLQAADHLEKQDDGSVTVVLVGGRVLSIWPDGTQQTRDPGTNGSYERARVCGNVLVYQPIADKIFCYAYFPELPN